MESDGRVLPREEEITHVGAPTPGRNPEVDARGRKSLKYYGTTFDDDPDGITKSINKIIHGYYDGPWKTFGEVPQAVIDQWWREFQNKYYWEDHQGPQIFKNWRAKCSRHISNTFNDHRDKKTKPKWVSSENWASMMKYWEEDENFLRKSETNKKNRSSESQDGRSNYAGGSTSAAGYAIKFRKKYGREITMEELLKKTHTNKKTGVFDDARARICLERYEKLVAEWLERHDSLSEEKQLELCIIACGGEKKGHVFGFGSNYCKNMLVVNPPDFSPNPPPAPRPALAASLPPPAPHVLQPSSPLVQLTQAPPGAQFVVGMSTPLVQPTQAPPGAQFVTGMSTHFVQHTQAPPPPPPMLRPGDPSIMRNLDAELAIWEDKYRKIQLYQDGVRRMQLGMSQPSSPQPQAPLHSYSSMPPLMNSPPRYVPEFHPNVTFARPPFENDSQI